MSADELRELADTLNGRVQKGGQVSITEIAHKKLVESHRVIYELVNSSDDETYYVLGFWLDKADAIAAASADSPVQLDMDADGFAAVEVREHPLGLNPSERYRVVFRRKWEQQLNEPADEWEWRVTETEVKS